MADTNFYFKKAVTSCRLKCMAYYHKYIGQEESHEKGNSIRTVGFYPAVRF